MSRIILHVRIRFCFFDTNRYVGSHIDRTRKIVFSCRKIDFLPTLDPCSSFWVHSLLLKGLVKILVTFILLLYRSQRIITLTQILWQCFNLIYDSHKKKKLQRQSYVSEIYKVRMLCRMRDFDMSNFSYKKLIYFYN